MIRSGNICLSLLYNYLVSGNNDEKDYKDGGNKQLVNNY